MSQPGLRPLLNPPPKYEDMTGKQLQRACEFRGLYFQGAKCHMISQLVNSDFTKQKKDLKKYIEMTLMIDKDGSLKDKAIKMVIKYQEEGAKLKYEAQKIYYEKRIATINEEFKDDMEATVSLLKEMSAYVPDFDKDARSEAGAVDSGESREESDGTSSKADGAVSAMQVSENSNDDLGDENDGAHFVDESAQGRQKRPRIRARPKVKPAPLNPYSGLRR